MRFEIDTLKYELRINSSLASKVAILIIRLEKKSLLRYIILPFRVIILNFFFNTEIPRVIKIGKGLRLPHPYGIIIHTSCVIGDNVTIFHDVTLGLNEFKSNKGPKLGSNIYIGTKASVIGDVTIESNVVVAIHSVITKNIPENKYCEGKNCIKENNQK